MSMMDRAVKEQRQNEIEKNNGKAINFMGGISYVWNPMDTLKMVTASSIFGEPAYYRDGEFAPKTARDGVAGFNPVFRAYVIGDLLDFEGLKTSELMERAIDNALTYDFKGTLEWAETLRREYLMRLNPQVIMVRAAMHPKRAEFTAEHPGMFAEINSRVMSRADEPASQLTYFLYRKGSKAGMPNILKKSWAKKLEGLSDYEMYKYRNTGIGMIDTVRICHANSGKIDTLMKTGTIPVEDDQLTWERLRAEGKTWREILDTIQIGHMALLRNLRGIFTEIDDRETAVKILEKLKAGVLKGKQFPFRYYSAYKVIDKSSVNFRQMILDTLEECIDIACDNMPKLKGRTACLSDNSGSAWGTLTSEYGSVIVAEIGNLSSLITAHNSDEGTVGLFGDCLDTVSVSKRNGILTQAEKINERGKKVGMGTENGVWLFFEEAIREKKHYDNIFIYSDMQAGHGRLYGTESESKKYKELGFSAQHSVWGADFIDVAKLVDTYRKKVNPKVNVFCVQTAGYDDVVLPESGYRTTLLYGWTGKELVYADIMNRFWDEKDREAEAAKAKNSPKQKKQEPEE